MPAAALLAGAASLAAGIGSSIINSNNVSSTNAANAHIAYENRQFMYDQWLRENAYNDPSAAMQRLARAGLNPNLMYGEGAGGLPASASMQAVDMPRMNAYQVDPMMAAQIANLAADTSLKKTQGEKNLSDIDVNQGIIKVNDSVCVYNQALTSMTKAQQDKIIGETQMLGTMVDQINADIRLKDATIQNMKEERYLQSVELAIKSKEVDALCDKYAAETNLTNEEIKYYGLLTMAKIRNLDADTLLKQAGVKLTQAQTAEARVRMANLTVENGMLRWNFNQSLKYDSSEREIRIAQGIANVVEAIYKDALTTGTGNYSREKAANQMVSQLPFANPLAQ